MRTIGSGLLSPGLNTEATHQRCQYQSLLRYAIEMHRPETWGILQFEDSLKVSATYYQDGFGDEDGWGLESERVGVSDAFTPCGACAMRYRSGRAEGRPWQSTTRSTRMRRSTEVPSSFPM